MLNELYKLQLCLQANGISVGNPHQNIKTPGKSEGFLVGIDSNGLPETLEYLSPQNLVKLWTLRKGNHNSFPCVKLKPILKLEPDDKIFEYFEKEKQIDNKKRLLSEVIEIYDFYENKVLAEWTKAQIETLRDKDKKLDAIIILSERLSHVNDWKIFFHKLAEKLLSELDDKTTGLIKKTLIGDIKKNGRELKIVSDVPIFLDLSDWNNYECRVASPEMKNLVNNNLLKPTVADNTNRGEISAFGGNGIHTGPYPDPKLPIIGITYLFSMNENVLCHKRYGKTGSEIFSTSSEEVVAMQGAIEWCTYESRKGKTWQGIPNIDKKQDLVIAYLEEKPQAEIDLASVFTSFDVSDNEIGEAVYENKTKGVFDALKCEKDLTKDSTVNVLVITKVDDGRAQLVLREKYSIKNIANSIEQWQIAAKNIPYFSIIMPGKAGEKAKIIEPYCPSPVEIMHCLQNQWIKNGYDKRDVSGITLKHIYELYFEQQKRSQQTTKMILKLILQRLGPLFIGIGAADHAGEIKECKPEARKTVLVGISLLGILLYNLNIKKEDFMINSAFSLGRLLAFADKLHAQYCNLQMRRKDKGLPPQLIGNAYLPVAFENPDKALALLGVRLRIYYAWATKVQGDEYKLTKWILNEMGKISSGLENVTWPSISDDAIKAQVLLGYLAHSKSDEK